MSFYWSVAWRNLWRHKRRTLITAFAMASAVAVVMWSIAFTDGSYAQIFELAVERQLGHAQVHHPDYPARGLVYDTLRGRGALLAEVDALEGTVAASPRLEGFALLGGDTTSAGCQLVGVDPTRHPAVSAILGSLQEGAWLSEAAGREIVLGRALAEEIEVGVGDAAVALTQAADGSVGNELFTVVGLFETGDVGKDQGSGYLHIADAEGLFVLPDQAHGITVLTDDHTRVEPYTARLRAAVGGDGVEVQTWWEASPEIARMMGMRDTTGILLLTIIFLVAAFGVVNTMLMSVFERTRELGVMRALGLRPRSLVWLVVLESFMLAGLACTAGLVAGGLLDWHGVVYGVDFSSTMPEGMVWEGMRLDPVMKAEVRPGPIAYTVVGVFVVSVLASLWPAWRAARLRPVDALREE
jgi:ABC-type lipoprotein release transport system permease subunit